VHWLNLFAKFSVTERTADFMQIAIFVKKLLRGPNISKLGHMHQATPTLGSIYIPYGGGVRPLLVYQIWLRSLNSFKSY